MKLHRTYELFFIRCAITQSLFHYSGTSAQIPTLFFKFTMLQPSLTGQWLQLARLLIITSGAINFIASLGHSVLDTSDLELHCLCSDPNYGHVWFHCRKSPIDTAREVINNTKLMLAVDIKDYSFIYVAAMVRRMGILMIINYQVDMINLHTDSTQAPSARV